MESEILEDQELKQTRRPADIFRSCPHCESTNMFRFEGEAFCLYCGWDSVLLHAEIKFAKRTRTPLAASVSALKQIKPNFQTRPECPARALIQAAEPAIA